MYIYLIKNKKDKLLISTKECGLRYFSGCKYDFNRGKSTKINKFIEEGDYELILIDKIEKNRILINQQLIHYNFLLNKMNEDDFLKFYEKYPIE